MKISVPKYQDFSWTSDQLAAIKQAMEWITDLQEIGWKFDYMDVSMRDKEIRVRMFCQVDVEVPEL